MEDANSSENNGTTTEHFPMDFRKKLKSQVEVTVTLRGPAEKLVPIVESFRKLVEEDTHSAQEKSFIHQNWNSVDEATTSRPRNLVLEFSDEVSDSVLTGKEIKGKGGNDIKISLLDTVNGHPVISAALNTVEIRILEVDPNDNICNAKPRFRKPVYVPLEEGIGVLSKVKLAYDSCWTKKCKCRLGARVVDASDGSIVAEASTNPFTVLDGHCDYNKKHYPPNLRDPLWRLDKIGRGGSPCERLQKGKIDTVQKFLFSLNIDPQIPRTMFRASDKTWSTIVAHARQCNFDDTKIHFYSPSPEYKTGVVFDAVGQLKGLIHNHHFVHIESVSQSEKEEARKLLVSAFENWKDITFLDKISFRHQFPPSISNATNSARLDGPDHNGIMDEVTVAYDHTQSQVIDPSVNHPNGSSHFGSLVGNENAAETHERVPESYLSFDSTEGFFLEDLVDEFSL